MSIFRRFDEVPADGRGYARRVLPVREQPCRGSGTPVHVHAKDDETIYVREGEMQAVIAGVVKTAYAGEVIFLPRGVPHQLRNTSERASRYAILCVPSGF
jgi:mannose-6-phosphate isomerase-like protein (cupin superfamily)